MGGVLENAARFIEHVLYRSQPKSPYACFCIVSFLISEDRLRSSSFEVEACRFLCSRVAGLQVAQTGVDHAEIRLFVASPGFLFNDESKCFPFPHLPCFFSGCVLREDGL